MIDYVAKKILIMNVLNYLSENAEELIDKIFKYKVSDVCIKKNRKYTDKK